MLRGSLAFANAANQHKNYSKLHCYNRQNNPVVVVLHRVCRDKEKNVKKKLLVRPKK